MFQEIYLSFQKIIHTIETLKLKVSFHPSEIKLALQDEKPLHISTDSRKLNKNSVFIAIKGSNDDGHLFIKEALEKELSLVICEKQGEKLYEDKTMILELTQTRLLWAHLCAESFNSPQLRMSCIGITGTNGKTSTAWMIQQILSKLGVKSLYIGTLGAYLDESYYPLEHTTPDPSELFYLLDQALKQGVSHLVLEVSSHALCQERLGPLKCDISVFTSFTRDHLDFHKSLANYWQAKLLLFSKQSKKKAWAIVNKTPYEQGLDKVLEKDFKILTYASINDLNTNSKLKNHLTVSLLQTKRSSSLINLDSSQGTFTGEIPYLGRHNCENFLSAWTVAYLLSKKHLAANKWLELKAIPGRLSPIDCKDKEAPQVFIDYAHTPDALEKALLLLKELKHEKIFLVFGCGGNRDQGKRKKMAVVAEKHAHLSFVTDDNPRNEDSQKILSEISCGFQNNKNFMCLSPREKAIEKAILQAETNDLVLIAGKGHENYQIIQGARRPFEDEKEAYRALAKRKEKLI